MRCQVIVLMLGVVMSTTIDVDTITGTFEIEPQGPYSLATAASFEFGPKLGRRGEGLPLAFALDNVAETAAVAIHQDTEDGPLQATVQGSGDMKAVRGQVARILSLDQDARGWPEVGRRDPVIGALQARHPGFRPVLFHSPYEAAAWSVLYGRKRLAQVRRLRDRVAEEYGDTYQVEGEILRAFPPAERLLEVQVQPWLPELLVKRLHAVARFALEGRLDTARLREMDPDQALADLRTLSGVGPFFANLILQRAAGVMAVWRHSPELDACIRHYYGVDPEEPGVFEEIGCRLAPFGTWSAVLVRRCGYEEGVR